MAYDRLAFRMRREYGDVAMFRLPWKDSVVVSDPVLVADVLAQENGLYRQGTPTATLKFAENGGAFVLEGEEHRRRRAVLDPSFSEEGLDEIEEMVIERVLATSESWRADDELEMVDEMMRLATGIICDLAFDRDLDADPDVYLEFRRHGAVAFALHTLPLSKLWRSLPLPSVQGFKRAYKKFEEMVEAHIEQARTDGVAGRRSALMNMVSGGERGEVRPFTLGEARDETMLLFGSGVGPVAFTLCWCFYLLSRNPEARARLEADTDKVLNGGPIAAGSHREFTYAFAVLQETRRLCPYAFLLDKVTNEDCVLGDYFIPKDTTVIPAIGVVHRREDLFERPLEFRPERWLDGSAPSTPDHGYLPHASGYRGCSGTGLMDRIGAYALTEVSRRWRLEPVAGRTVRPRYGIDAGYKLKGGLRVHARER